MRLFACLLIVLLSVTPVAARDVTEAGSVAASGVTLDASTGSARNVTLSVTSTGPDATSGTSAVSSATATGVQGRNRTAYTADRVAVTATSGPVNQQGTTVNVGSLSTARGVQLSGRTAQSLTASDLSVHAVSDTATGTGSGRRSQGRADAFAAGIWMLSNGNAALSGTSSVEALAGTAAVSGGDSLAVATAQAIGVSVGQLGTPAANAVTHSGTLTVRAVGGTASAEGQPAYTEAWAEAVGLQAVTGQVTNSGTVQVSAEGGTSSAKNTGAPAPGNTALAHARAQGLVATGAVTNSGDLQVTAASGTAQNAFTNNADTAALGIVTEGEVLNSGSISVRTVTSPGVATGIQTSADVTNTGTLRVASTTTGTGVQTSGNVRNAGTITVSGATATGLQAESVSNAGGVTVSGDTATGIVAAAVNNGGTITVNGGTAIGIDAPDVTNSGSLTVIADTATGLKAQSVRNVGRITASGATATGLEGESVTSTGTITVSGNTATGIHALSVDNGGSINASGGTATGIVAAAVDNGGTITVNGGTATGVAAQSMNNTGMITVSGDTATALRLTDGADVYNGGNISAQGSTSATGVLFDGAGSLFSSAPIAVSGGRPWEVVSGQAGQTVRVSAYNLGLGRNTGRTFGGPGNIFMDEATLTLRPAPGFVENQYFAVQTPPDGQSELGEAVVGGHVARVVSTHPDLQAAVRSEAAGQSVALLYEPPASLPGESIHAQQTTVMYTGTVLRDHLAESLFMPSLSSQSHGLFFARPYAMRLTHTGGPAGYHGTLSGALLGMTGRVGDTLVGVHLGGDVTNLDFRGAYDGRSEESTAFYGGVHAGQRWDNVGVMLTSSLFRAEHRADYGQEHATAQSLAWFNTLGLNWRWQLTEHQALVPEASLLHIWQFRNNYHTKADPNSVSTRYDDFNNHEVFATAGLRWVASLPLSRGTLRLHTGGGVQQTLTDGKIRVEQFMDGTRHARPETQSERTLGFASAGIGFDVDRLSLDVGWQGSFSSHTQGQGLQAIVRYQF